MWPWILGDGVNARAKSEKGRRKNLRTRGRRREWKRKSWDKKHLNFFFSLYTLAYFTGNKFPLKLNEWPGLKQW